MFDMEISYSEIDKRKLLIPVFTLVILGLFAFSEVFVAGAKFMTGNNLETTDKRFSSNSSDNKEPWVQESYEEEISKLSEMERYVTQQNGTEPPFQNELYDEKRSGIYVDVVSGEPLFSSKHKFDSGTGWPSFYKPLEPENIIERRDPGPLGDRVEVASRHAKSHLGHVFQHPDTPTNLRYCLNSAALEFIPAERLEEQGYEKYRSMFSNQTSKTG